MPRLPRTFLVACSCAVFGSLGTPTLAAPWSPPVVAKPKPPLEGKKPVAVGTIAGKHAGKARALIFERLKESNAYEVTDAEDLKPGDKKFTLAKAAKGMNVAGVMLGRVSDKYDLTLVIYNSTGKLVKEVVIRGGTAQKLENAIRNEFNLLAGEALAQATGGKNLAEVKPQTEVVEDEEEEEPSEPEVAEPKKKKKKKKKVEEEEEEEEDEEDEEDEKKDDKSEPSRPGRAPFEAVAGIRGYNRQFAYDQPADQLPADQLLNYKLGLGPAVLIGARIYPVAFFRDDYLGNIGLVAGAELGIATSTDYVQNVEGGGQVVTKLKTSAQEWNVGLIFRIPVDPIEVDLFGVYGVHTFVLEGDEGGAGAQRPLVPDVKYAYMRPGIEGRLRISEVFASVHVAPRFLLSYQQIDLEGVWFPGATGSAFDFGLAGGYGVLPFLDVVVGFDFLRYGFDLSGIPTANRCPVDMPDPAGCQRVAAGASDTYISGWLGAMVRLGGSDPAKK